jgi:hypothetical protein
VKKAYQDIRFSKASLLIIDQANEIIDEYQAMGFILTLRQLFYQFVSRDLIPNTIQSYKRLGSIINDARMAGYISWEAIEDRTRNLKALAHWNSPHQILDAVISQYRMDKWGNQPYRPEVWIEKDALTGIIAGVCDEFDVPYFACRGYNSQSEQWAAGMRLERYHANGQIPIILHLGDHDPSGIDMTADNQKRLSIFAGFDVEVRRLALNYDQVEEYNPPPNPAKATDSRFDKYLEKFGDKCWELDALDPQVIADLVRYAIEDILDPEQWKYMIGEEDKDKARLRKAKDSL